MPAASAAAVPGVYVDLGELIALEQRGRRVSFLPRQPVHSLLSGRYASRMRGRGSTSRRSETIVPATTCARSTGR